jgi:hypothetical protein
MARTSLRKGVYSLWTEDLMKRAVSVMRGNVDILAALELFRIPNTTIKKRVEAARLRQKFQNDTVTCML